MIATLLSPSGIKIWDAILSLGSNTYITSRIPEYQSADFHQSETWPFLLLLLITIMALARTRTKTLWTYTLLAAAFTGLALYSSRMIPLFAIGHAMDARLLPGRQITRTADVPAYVEAGVHVLKLQGRSLPVELLSPLVRRFRDAIDARTAPPGTEPRPALPSGWTVVGR